MTRFTLVACLAALPSLGVGADLSSVLAGMERRYNRATTIQVFFQQTYKVQGRAPRTESGELFLRKPGRMRWQYTSPQGKLFVTDGKAAYLYTPSSNRVEKLSLKESDDMRAPLAFLLGKLDFRKYFQRFLSRPEGEDTFIAAEPKSADMPYTRVEFLVTPQFRIRHLEVTGQDHSVMVFGFDGEKLNPALPESLFRFQAPPGAEQADSGGR